MIAAKPDCCWRQSSPLTPITRTWSCWRCRAAVYPSRTKLPAHCEHRWTSLSFASACRNLLTAFAYRIVRRILAMSWYEAVPLLGSAAALSLMILVRPSSDARLVFTLLIGAPVLLSVGLAMKEVTTGIGTAYWLAH